MIFSKVIKYEGDNKTFVWKHPIEDFTTGTQLIVRESQEAIFVSDGRILDIFGAGRYTLETANLPLISAIMGLATHGKTAFSCELYFVNKTEQMAIPWGTDSKIQYIDPIYGFPVKIGACGEMSLSIENSGKLVVKIVGTEQSLSQEQLVEKLRVFVMKHVKSLMSRYITENKINVFELDMHLTAFSEHIHKDLADEFVDYGVDLAKFSVMTIVTPEDDPNFIRFRQLHYRRINEVAEAELKQRLDLIAQNTEAQKTVIAAEAMARKRSMEDYTYQQEHGFEVASKMAENNAVGQFNNIGIGLGMMAGIGGTLGRQVGAMATGAMQTAGNALSSDANQTVAKVEGTAGMSMAHKRFCMQCGSQLNPNARFCERCGAKVSAESCCTGCGYVFTNDALFCPSCGKKRGE